MYLLSFMFITSQRSGITSNVMCHKAKFLRTKANGIFIYTYIHPYISHKGYGKRKRRFRCTFMNHHHSHLNGNAFNVRNGHIFSIRNFHVNIHILYIPYTHTHIQYTQIYIGIFYNKCITNWTIRFCKYVFKLLPDN